jgi:O-antigen/teichoic acid export membrane protein
LYGYGNGERLPKAKKKRHFNAAELMELTGKQLTTNFGLNLAGQVLPLLIGLAAMPYAIRGFGAERFGILSIAWALLSYTGLLDMGLGRATTKFVAEYLGKGEVEKIPEIVWTSLWSQLMLGLVGALVSGLLVPVIVHRVLKIPAALSREALVSFLIMSLSLPLVLAGNTFRGVLEAAQHFRVVNYVKIPANASIFIAPALAVPLGLRLPGVVLLLVAVRFGSTIAYFIACNKAFPLVRKAVGFRLQMLSPMLAFGGWVTVSNVVGPFLVYMDRFFIGSVISMAAVAYYTAPYEVITRALIIPASLSITVFPAFSTLGAGGSARRTQELCIRSLKCILLLMGPVLILVIAFAHRILAIWLGSEFAEHGTTVLQILALGVLANSLAYIVFSLLQGIGRPDIVAKCHLVELVLYAMLLWFLLKHIGIVGAALAWTMRVALDAILLSAAASSVRAVSFRAMMGGDLWKATAALVVFSMALAVLSLGEYSVVVQGLTAGVLLAGFCVAAWRYVMDARDKEAVFSAAYSLRTALARTRCAGTSLL